MMRYAVVCRARVGWYGRIIVFLAGVFLATGCSPTGEPETVNIVQALSSDRDDDCYDRAVTPGIIRFPGDYGPHDSFKTEWWYYTGNVKTGDGRHFGYQLTFFRQALACDSSSGTSAWRTNQLYFAHFAVADTRNRKFYSAQRMNRGSVGIAGAKASPFRGWIDDWTASASTGSGIRTLLLNARDAGKSDQKEDGNGDLKEISIDLTLTPQKPAILQGNRGLSKKGPGPYDASHYYSFPGMTTQGRIFVGDEMYTVSGRSWFDHEWSTSALGEDVAGWDWFAVHIETGIHAGTDFMVCQVRKADGRPNGHGFGSVSLPDGRYAILGNSGFSITPTRYWKSPVTGKTYPAGWTISLAAPSLSLEVTPVTDGQEHTHMFPYYEGAVRVGFSYGYVEMTGY